MFLKTILFPILVCIWLLAGSCSHSMSYEKAIDYVNNPKNGLVQEKEINGVKYKLTYRPGDILVCQELSGRENISEKDISEARKRYSQQHYFLLSITQGGKEILSTAVDKERFSMLVNQLSFGMGAKVLLTTQERDTLQLLDFQSPRYFGLSPATDILFAFEKKDIRTQTLIFTLEEFGLSTGNTRFIFNLNDIKKISNEKVDITID